MADQPRRTNHRHGYGNRLERLNHVHRANRRGQRIHYNIYRHIDSGVYYRNRCFIACFRVRADGRNILYI